MRQSKPMEGFCGSQTFRTWWCFGGIRSVGGVRRRLCRGVCHARASAASRSRSGRICAWSRIRLGRRLLGFARFQLGLGERTMGASPTRPYGLGCGPLGAPRRTLALQSRSLAIIQLWRTHSCVPRSHSCERHPYNSYGCPGNPTTPSWCSLSADRKSRTTLFRFWRTFCAGATCLASACSRSRSITTTSAARARSTIRTAR